MKVRTFSRPTEQATKVERTLTITTTSFVESVETVNSREYTLYEQDKRIWSHRVSDRFYLSGILFLVSSADNTGGCQGDRSMTSEGTGLFHKNQGTLIMAL